MIAILCDFITSSHYARYTAISCIYISIFTCIVFLSAVILSRA